MGFASFTEIIREIANQVRSRLLLFPRVFFYIILPFFFIVHSRVILLNCLHANQFFSFFHLLFYNELLVDLNIPVVCCFFTFDNDFILNDIE